MSLEDQYVTLSLDFGGSSVKSAVLAPNGTPTGGFITEILTYPFTPHDLLDAIAHHSHHHDRRFDRITVGLPGVIRSGRVVVTPHYVCDAGPNTSVNEDLAAAWNGCDIRQLIVERFAVPTLVLNDAQVAAAGVVSGTGAELVLTLGTGLGCAFIIDGTLTPHLEISHALGFDNRIYDDIVGQAALDRSTPAQWSADVARAIDSLYEIYHWDRLYIGGGNSFKLTADIRSRLLDAGATFLSYEAGAFGGVRAWEFVK